MINLKEQKNKLSNINDTWLIKESENFAFASLLMNNNSLFLWFDFCIFHCWLRTFYWCVVRLWLRSFICLMLEWCHLLRFTFLILLVILLLSVNWFFFFNMKIFLWDIIFAFSFFNKSLFFQFKSSVCTN